MGMVRNYDNDSQRAVHDLAHARVKITELEQTIQRESELSDRLAETLKEVPWILSICNEPRFEAARTALAQYTASRSEAAAAPK